MRFSTVNRKGEVLVRFTTEEESVSSLFTVVSVARKSDAGDLIEEGGDVANNEDIVIIES